MPKKAETFGFDISAAGGVLSGTTGQEVKKNELRKECPGSVKDRCLDMLFQSTVGGWAWSFSGKVRTIQSGLYFVQDSWINLHRIIAGRAVTEVNSLSTVTF